MKITDEKLQEVAARTRLGDVNVESLNRFCAEVAAIHGDREVESIDAAEEMSVDDVRVSLLVIALLGKLGILGTGAEP